MLSKLKVTKEQFFLTERELMSDPLAQMELLENGIDTEDPDQPSPEGLGKERTIEIIKEANDESFPKFKELHP